MGRRVLVLKAGSRPPWVGLAAAVWVQVASGNAYNFPLYSHSLKSVLGYNQQQLTFLGVANDLGENAGLLAGLACNKLLPWAVLLIGAFACFLGYGLLWLSLSQFLSLPYWLLDGIVAAEINTIPEALYLLMKLELKIEHSLWIALAVATNSGAWLGTGVLVTNMRNFPLSRGTVAGLLKGYAGISAAVYTEIYSGVLHNSSTKLLLFLTLGIPAICLALVYVIRPCTPSLEEDSTDRCHFIFTQAASVFLAIYLLTTTIINDVLSVSDVVYYIFLGIMVLILLAPLAIPIKMTIYPTNPKRSGILSRSASTDPLIPEHDQREPSLPVSSDIGSFREVDDESDVDMLLAEGEGAVKKKRRPRRGQDFTFSQAVVKADFWLLFLVYFLGVGSGVTVLNNLAQIGITEGVVDTTILLSLFSFCNFVGRLGGGAVSEYFVRWKTIPRTIWMAFTQVIMVISYLLYASFINGTLYVATALLGICYGVQFSIMVPTASKLFGLKHFGIIYNFMLIGNPLGALLFSGLLAGYVYEQEAERQHGGRLLSSDSCLGPNCFRLTFLILAGLCGLGSILSIILTVRIRPVYQMLYSGGSFRLPQASNH